MSYFEHTKKDLADAKRELADLFCALAEDTARKMDNPDEYGDRTYLLEDLLTRIAELADAEGRNVSHGYPDLQAGCRPRPAYDLLPPDTSTEVTQEIGVANYRTHGDPVIGVEPGLSAMTLREVHNTTHFDGVQRHPFEAGFSGMSCSRMVTRNGSGEDCGLPFDNAIHDWQW